MTARPFLLIHGGRIFTGDRGRPWVSALVVGGGAVLAVGSLEALRRDHPEAVELDVGGRTVLPGLVDAHNHFLATGEMLASVDVRYPRVDSVAALVSTVRESAACTPAGQWVTATGFDHAKYERMPTRHDLDEATTSHPVFVLHVSGHQGLANSLALDLQGVGDDIEDPPGGTVVRDAAGRPTGLFLEAALGLLQPVAVDVGHHGPNFHVARPVDDLVAAVERAGRAFLEVGVTTVCDAQVTRRELTAYQAARAAGRLPVRTVCMPLSHQLDELAATGLRTGFGDDWLRFGPMKFYADGSLIGGTAWFSEPYGVDGELTGTSYWEPAEFVEAVVTAHRHGWRIGVHAQGDRGIGLAVQAFETAQLAHPVDDPRFRVEHAGWPTPAQLDTLARLGATTVNQPVYLRDSGDDFLDRLGSRAHRLQPWREELAAGVGVVISSDSDVATFNPFETIAAAMSRTTYSGQSVGPDQRLTLEEALLAHTSDAAWACGIEERVGALRPSMAADVVVVDADLSAAASAEIADATVWLTILDGEVAFAQPDAAATLSRWM